MGRDDGERECPKGQPLQQQAGRAQRRQRRPDPVRRSGCERQRGRQAAGARAHDHHALAERVGGGSVGDRGISAAGGGDGGGVGLADSRWGGSCAVGDGAEGKHPICRMRVGPFQYTVLTVVDVNVLCRGHSDPCRFSSARAAADARPQSAPGPCGPHQPRSGRALGGDALANVDRRRGAFPPPRLSCMPPTLPPSALSPAAPDLSPLSRGPVSWSSGVECRPRLYYLAAMVAAPTAPAPPRRGTSPSPPRRGVHGCLAVWGERLGW